jgi:hypothetical protein
MENGWSWPFLALGQKLHIRIKTDSFTLGSRHGVRDWYIAGQP